MPGASRRPSAALIPAVTAMLLAAASAVAAAGEESARPQSRPRSGEAIVLPTTPGLAERTPITRISVPAGARSVAAAPADGRAIPVPANARGPEPDRRPRADEAPSAAQVEGAVIGWPTAVWSGPRRAHIGRVYPRAHKRPITRTYGFDDPHSPHVRAFDRATRTDTSVHERADREAQLSFHRSTLAPRAPARSHLADQTAPPRRPVHRERDRGHDRRPIHRGDRRR